MLKEKISYQEGLPVNCYVADIRDYPIHFHDDMEVVFVLQGSLRLKNGYYTYTLKPGDVFILNDREIHSFYGTEGKNTVMLLQLDLLYFSKYYDNLRNNFFVTDMKDNSDESLEGLRGILAQIMMDFTLAEPACERKIIENSHNLIDCLITNFQYFLMEDGKFVNETKNKGNKILAGRMKRISDYMYENHGRRLTLNEIADSEHLSIYYLSHVIKEATGLSFQELLSFIRVEESEKLLLGTEKKIGAISEESGFSAVRYYIKYFEKWFGMHPTEYRQMYTGHVQGRDVDSVLFPAEKEEILGLIRKHAKEVYEYGNRNKVRIETAELDAFGPRGTFSPLRELLDNMPFCSSPRAAFELLSRFGDLDEEPFAYGEHFIATRTREKKDGGMNDREERGFSLLFFNFDEKLFRKKGAEISFEEVRDAINRYAGKLEVLVRLNGLLGEYTLSRCFLAKESLQASCRNEGDFFTGKRERVLEHLRELPSFSTETLQAVDQLSVKSYLSGFAMELILITAK